MKTKKNENKSKQRSNRNKSSKIKNSKNTLKYMIIGLFEKLNKGLVLFFYKTLNIINRYFSLIISSAKYCIMNTYFF